MKRGSTKTWYTYDSTGQRVRKVTEKGGITEERLYLGAWEIYRKRQGTTVTLERETLHLMDGARRTVWNQFLLGIRAVGIRIQRVSAPIVTRCRPFVRITSAIRSP